MNDSKIGFMSWFESLGALALLGVIVAFVNAGGAMRSIADWRRERRRGRMISNVRFY